MRIVSLSPSATETLCSIGGSPLLVGRSDRCLFPPEALSLPAIHRGDHRGLAALNPELVLTQGARSATKAEANRDHIETLRQAAASPLPAAVLSLNSETVEDIVDACLTVGAAAGLHESAQKAAISLRGDLFQACECVNPYEDGPAVAVVTSLDPLIVAGGWVSQLVERAGGRHVLNPTTPQPQAGLAVGPQAAQRDVPPPKVVTPADLAGAGLDWVVVAVPDLTAEAAKIALSGENGVFPTSGAGSSIKDGPRLAWVDASQQLNLASPRIAADLWFLSSLFNARPELTPADYPSVIL